ncbi:MAG: ATP-binding cassette domain-containing protein [Candidatus Neomarinimicrobiota bacterium]
MILRTENLTKSFKGRKAVQGLSIEIPDGSVFGFLGPNGSGKSTTIRMMTALIKPDQGDVFINEISVRKQHHRALKKVGSFIERADFYKHLSARTNLEMLARMDGASPGKVQEVLSRVGLGKRAEDRIKHYSQGMKQRLGIAQALLTDPKLLILDEPTNGLDPQGMKEVRDLIKSLQQEGVTIFLSSHLLDEVEKICTHVALLNKGKLLTTGKIKDFLDSALCTTEIRALPLDKAKKVLQGRAWIQNCKVGENALWVAVDSTRIPDVLKILIEHNIKVEAVIPRTTLETVFLSKIGPGSEI